jgi:hypothetical protein
MMAVFLDMVCRRFKTILFLVLLRLTLLPGCVVPALWGLRQENRKFETSLSYIARPLLRKKRDELYLFLSGCYIYMVQNSNGISRIQ